MVGQNDGRDAFDSIKNNPDFLGVKKVYLWKNIETAENVYNFSEIEQDLAYLQSIGKRLWLEIGYTEWNGTVSPRVPYYMWNDSKYGGNPGRHGAYQAPSYGSAPKPEDPWYAVIWNTNVQGRFVRSTRRWGSALTANHTWRGLTSEKRACRLAQDTPPPG